MKSGVEGFGACSTMLTCGSRVNDTGGALSQTERQPSLGSRSSEHVTLAHSEFDYSSSRKLMSSAPRDSDRFVVVSDVVVGLRCIPTEPVSPTLERPMLRLLPLGMRRYTASKLDLRQSSDRVVPLPHSKTRPN